MKKKKVKVICVTETEFELNDGRVFQHPEKLDDVPTVDEFQRIYDYWSEILKGNVTVVRKIDRNK